MIYITEYKSPIGEITLAAENDKLTGLWIEGQKYFMEHLKKDFNKFTRCDKEDIDIFFKTKDWLKRYFNGQKPSIDELDLDPKGSDFRKSVWKILCRIPYGQVITYNDIAKEIAKEKGIEKMSAQAIGGAVGHNPISIVIPCHRVISVSGSLTGYAGGIDKKIFLLKHENVDMTNMFIPEKGTAL